MAGKKTPPKSGRDSKELDRLHMQNLKERTNYRRITPDCQEFQRVAKEIMVNRDKTYSSESRTL
ncbi:MAG: hypothetical protein RBR06_08600 [Desulfuromonadaceae bacterium]|nr:hypothetical protein [Desulfuromonadaceae bacterium]